MSLEGALVANRFGLGAKPGEIDAASDNPKAWLLNQLTRGEDTTRFADLPPTSELAAQLVKQQQLRQAKDKDALKSFLMQARQTYLREMAARFLVGFETEAPLHERLLRFGAIISLSRRRSRNAPSLSAPSNAKPFARMSRDASPT